MVVEDLAHIIGKQPTIQPIPKVMYPKYSRLVFIFWHRQCIVAKVKYQIMV